MHAKQLMFTMALVAALSLPVFAKEGTWTGRISDSHCGATHKKEMLAKHAKDTGKTGSVDDRECTELCVKDGAKYVFVSKGRVYQISNQDLNLLKEHAGHTVTLTGDMTGKTVKVSNITMPSTPDSKQKKN
jgi:hypothetical protein